MFSDIKIYPAFYESVFFSISQGNDPGGRG